MNAKAIFEKTFGGLSREYYFREFIFGLIFVVLFFYPYYVKGMTIPPIGVILTAILSQILYPYSRFVYHSTTDFIFGNNMFIVNAFLMLILKVVMMMICCDFCRTNRAFVPLLSSYKRREKIGSRRTISPRYRWTTIKRGKSLFFHVFYYCIFL